MNIYIASGPFEPVHVFLLDVWYNMYGVVAPSPTNFLQILLIVPNSEARAPAYDIIF
jgi:hypothetical protein